METPALLPSVRPAPNMNNAEEVGDFCKRMGCQKGSLYCLMCGNAHEKGRLQAWLSCAEACWQCAQKHQDNPCPRYDQRWSRATWARRLGLSKRSFDQKYDSIFHKAGITFAAEQVTTLRHDSLRQSPPEPVYLAYTSPKTGHPMDMTALAHIFPPFDSHEAHHHLGVASTTADCTPNQTQIREASTSPPSPKAPGLATASRLPRPRAIRSSSCPVLPLRSLKPQVKVARARESSTANLIASNPSISDGLGMPDQCSDSSCGYPQVSPGNPDMINFMRSHGSFEDILCSGEFHRWQCTLGRGLSKLPESMHCRLYAGEVLTVDEVTNGLLEHVLRVPMITSTEIQTLQFDMVQVLGFSEVRVANFFLLVWEAFAAWERAHDRGDSR